MAKYGLQASLGDAENGMIESDMVASRNAANLLDEVIIFRSTGPWSQRWIKLSYPTKNFHVKGKSSDWGPQAGFVPYLGKYSKVGHDLGKANDGTAANDDGLKHKFASKVVLTLSMDEMRTQNTLPCEVPPRVAVHTMEPVPDSKDFFLFARRSGDNREFAFRAVATGAIYQIHVYDEKVGTNKARIMFEKPEPLEVMTSSEVGAGNRPMTGDYDLMAVCPRWGDYASTSSKEISKEALDFSGKGKQAPLSFGAGSNMDRVLDMRTNTGARPKGGALNKTYGGLTKKDGGKLLEHGDMGNLTPRILRCINTLNVQMGATGSRSALRRVHHNAESHRNHIFGALTKSTMDEGDGFPLTVFQPSSLLGPGSPVRVYEDICTLETMPEFRQYATLLHEAGYYVPKNWTWGMSIRDRYR